MFGLFAVPVIPDYLVTSEGLVLAPVPKHPFPLTAGLLGGGGNATDATYVRRTNFREHSRS